MNSRTHFIQSLSVIFIVLCSPFLRNPIVLEERLPLPEHKSILRKKKQYISLYFYTKGPWKLEVWKAVTKYYV